ncbi:MAG: amidohydrolase family protein [Candidatus Heimdallarchaeota archaeon]|nr:amidohydrolase family protein [Candidatus Heimdallarchaeota archaeon]
MSQEDKRLIVKSGNIFDSLTGSTLFNHTVVIEKNKIVWVNSDDDFAKEETDQIIDATGKTILPGMVECHVHIYASGNPHFEREYVRTKTDMYHYFALNNSQKHLQSGFTCVRDAGCYPGIAPALRRIFDTGLLAGPRLVVTDKGIWQWGNQEGVSPDPIINFDRENDQVLAGVDSVKHAVRDLKYRGANYVKTATTGGVLHGMESKVSFTLWTEEELEAIVKEAHRNDMHVAAHAHGKAGIVKAVKAGIDTIEHASFLDEEAVDLLVKQGNYIIPTQTAAMSLVSPALMQIMPPEIQKKTIEVDKQMKISHKLAFEKGVKIAIGTDAGTPGNYHGNTGNEVVLMVKDVGMTPVQAMQAATIGGAKAIWMDEKIGSLESGKFADLLICEQNPLENIDLITNYKNFSHVIKDGKVMVEKGKITYFSPLQPLHH